MRVDTTSNDTHTSTDVQVAATMATIAATIAAGAGPEL